MARKPKPAAQMMAPDVSTTPPPESAAEQQLVAAHNDQLATLDLQYALDAEPYDYLRVSAYLQAATQMQAKVALVIGRACLLLKMHETQGRFLQALEDAGIAPRSAQKYMAICRKFDGPEQRKLLAARLSISKLLELVTEHDDTLDALADGGSLAGCDLDEVERMSVSELKEALRRERQEREEEQATAEEIIGKKDQKLNTLARKLRGWDRSPVRDRAEELLQAVEEESVGVLSATKKLEEAIRGVAALFEQESMPIDPDIDQRIEQAVVNAESRLAELHQLAGI